MKTPQTKLPVVYNKQLILRCFSCESTTPGSICYCYIWIICAFGHLICLSICVVVVSHLRPMGLNVLGYQFHLLQHCHPVCGHEGYSHLSSRFSPYVFLSRCKFSTLTTRQSTVELYLLAFSRVPLRKPE